MCTRQGRYDVFEELLSRRYEYAIKHEEEYDFTLDYSTLFYGRSPSLDQRISIGPTDSQNQLHIEIAPAKELSPLQLDLFADLEHLGSRPEALKITYHNSKSIIPCFLGSPDFFEPKLSVNMRRTLQRNILGNSDLPNPIACESLGPELPRNSMLARYWDNMVIANIESLGIKAINLAENKIDKIAAIGNINGKRGNIGRQIMIKVSDFSGYVPLM